MIKHDVASLACKLLGIYTFLSAVHTIPPLMVQALTWTTKAPVGVVPSPRLLWFMNALPAVLYILAGLLLWLKSDILARRMVKETEPIARSPARISEIQAAAFSCLGLFTLLQVIARVGQTAASYLILNHRDALPQRDLSYLTLPEITSILIQLALGTWLLRGAPTLVTWLRPTRVAQDSESSALNSPPAEGRNI